MRSLNPPPYWRVALTLVALLLTQLFVAELLDAGYDLVQALTAAGAVCAIAQILARLLGGGGGGPGPQPPPQSPQSPTRAPTQPPSGSRL
ncbi:hypothetical protein [Actinomadura fibrosa]|uniref:Holin n=1 Tax=Actinomadura fibrosa TaxID=111802 RepID=A0ABW2XSQ4_9ACTN|nr:hypothetical protein [Actinomadura fibrosa]